MHEQAILAVPLHDRAMVLNQGGVNKFLPGRELLRVLQHAKFLNEKVFRPISLFKKSGGLQTKDNCLKGRRGREKVKNHCDIE